MATLAALASQPRVAVVRYDALQAARNAPASARLPQLEVVAPLTLEPIYAVVRADSPLRFVHQMQGKAINAGAPQGSRALTVNTLYRGLFGAELPAHPLRAQDETAALESLGAGKLDVVVLIGSASGVWFANLLAAQGAQFRLLAFDAAQTGGPKAFNSFLPLQAQPRSLGIFPTAPTPTLGVMSFLVTAQQGTPANAPAKRTGGEADSELVQQALATLTADLCMGRSKANVLPASQRVDPTLKLDVGWPYSDTAQRLLSRCGGTSTVARTPTAGSS